jgi:hypothetical protein
MLLGMLVIGVTTAVAPAAEAAGDTIVGGCFAAVAEQEVVTNSQFQGEIAIAALTSDANGPSQARIDCWIAVNDVEQPGTRITDDSFGGHVKMQQITYSAVDGDRINLCEDVFFWSDFHDTGEICQPTVIIKDLPDVSNLGVGPLNKVFENYIDPIVCAILGRDLDDPFGVLGKVYDCPPYIS